MWAAGELEQRSSKRRWSAAAAAKISRLRLLFFSPFPSLSSSLFVLLFFHFPSFSFFSFSSFLPSLSLLPSSPMLHAPSAARFTVALAPRTAARTPAPVHARLCAPLHAKLLAASTHVLSAHARAHRVPAPLAALPAVDGDPARLPTRRARAARVPRATELRRTATALLCHLAARTTAEHRAAASPVGDKNRVRPPHVPQFPGAPLAAG